MRGRLHDHRLQKESGLRRGCALWQPRFVQEPALHPLISNDGVNSESNTMPIDAHMLGKAVDSTVLKAGKKFGHQSTQVFQ